MSTYLGKLILTNDEEAAELATRASAKPKKPGKARKVLRTYFPIEMGWYAHLSAGAIVVWSVVGTAWRMRRDERLPLVLSAEVIRWTGQSERSVRRRLQELVSFGLVMLVSAPGRRTRVIWVDIACHTPPPSGDE